MGTTETKQQNEESSYRVTETILKLRSSYICESSTISTSTKSPRFTILLFLKEIGEGRRNSRYLSRNEPDGSKSARVEIFLATHRETYAQDSRISRKRIKSADRVRDDLD